MARKPAAPATEELPPAMDYAQHEGTYRGFIAFVKWGIVNLVFIVLALYAFIEGHNWVAGLVLLVLSVVVPIVGPLMESRRQNA